MTSIYKGIQFAVYGTHLIRINRGSAPSPAVHNRIAKSLTQAESRSTQNIKICSMKEHVQGAYKALACSSFRLKILRLEEEVFEPLYRRCMTSGGYLSQTNYPLEKPVVNTQLVR